MRVIPFNPGGTGDSATGQPKGAPANATPRRAEGRDGEAGPDGHDHNGRHDHDHGDGDRDRAERLENALIAALRESAANWARAERAERLLGERAEGPLGERVPSPPADRG